MLKTTKEKSPEKNDKSKNLNTYIFHIQYSCILKCLNNCINPYADDTLKNISAEWSQIRLRSLDSHAKTTHSQWCCTPLTTVGQWHSNYVPNMNYKVEKCHTCLASSTCCVLQMLCITSSPWLKHLEWTVKSFREREGGRERGRGGESGGGGSPLTWTTATPCKNCSSGLTDTETMVALQCCLSVVSEAQCLNWGFGQII